MSGGAYQNRLTFATLPRTERGRPIVLGADPKGKTFLYTHGNSVIIRDLANPEIADVYTQHSCQVCKLFHIKCLNNSNDFNFSGQCGQILSLWFLHCLC